MMLLLLLRPPKLLKKVDKEVVVENFFPSFLFHSNLSESSGKLLSLVEDVAYSFVCSCAGQVGCSVAPLTNYRI